MIHSGGIHIACTINSFLEETNECNPYHDNKNQINITVTNEIYTTR